MVHQICDVICNAPIKESVAASIRKHFSDAYKGNTIYHGHGEKHPDGTECVGLVHIFEFKDAVDASKFPCPKNCVVVEDGGQTRFPDPADCCTPDWGIPSGVQIQFHFYSYDDPAEDLT